MSFANGKLMQTIILTKEEVESNPIWNGFYPMIARKLGVENYDKVKSLSCSEIEIANNIQEKWFEQNRERGYKDVDLAMFLICSAPKVDSELLDNTVMVSDKFMTL